MVLRTPTNFHKPEDETDEDRRLGDLDKQEKCDICQEKITDTRVIRSRLGVVEKYLGVFCSTKCSAESYRRENQKDDTKV